ncbi:xylulose 5-phosphate 3-epimerase, partial [Klebsiella michiganensis]
MKPRLGIYEKALPAALDWPKRFEMAAGLAFDFIEISVDESLERQARLRWNRGQRLAFVADKINSGIDVPS